MAAKSIFKVAISLGLVVMLTHKITGCAISENAASRIRLGMAKAEVVEVAGEPHWTDPTGWYYRVWNGCVTYSDMLYVTFNKDNRVDWVSF